MSQKLSPFPILDDAQKALLFEKQKLTISNYSMSYIHNNEGRHLDLKEIEPNVYSLVDQKNEWHPDKNDIHISLRFMLSNCNILYGRDGVACNNANLGLALIWTSSSSRQRGSVIIGDVKKSDKDYPFYKELVFEQAQVRGSIEVQVILFLKKAGNASAKETHLANIVGSRLGVLHEFSLMLDSKGSELPLYDVYEPNNKLLWYVRKYWDDPLIDLFTDSFSICFNKSHKDYPQLKLFDTNEMNPLLIEVMASAYSALILEMQKDCAWEKQISKGEDLECGTVAAAIYYFIQTFDINLESPISIAETIRKHLSAGEGHDCSRIK